MKSINKSPPTKSNKFDKFDGIVIGDEYKGPEKVEYIGLWCNRSPIRLNDRNKQSESWFCQNRSIEFNSDDKVSQRQKLSIPSLDAEPAVTSIGITSDVSIPHEPKLKGGFAALAKGL